jgi:hypothetical protein
MQAARPIDPRERDQFLRGVAAELAKYEVLGPGVIGRVVAKIQRQHLAPPSVHNRKAALLPRGTMRRSGSELEQTQTKA